MIMCHVGLGCYVSASRTVALIQPGSITAKRRINLAKRLNKFVDCTRGKGVRCYVLMDDNMVVASHLTPSTLAKRFANPFTANGDAQGGRGLERPHHDYDDPILTRVGYEEPESDDYEDPYDADILGEEEGADEYEEDDIDENQFDDLPDRE